MNKFIHLFIFELLSVLFLLFLMRSESYIDFRDYQTINYTFSVNQFVNESINSL